jgi:tRNA nucleotidyltransferase (CCA-adding enzyme)
LQEAGHQAYVVGGCVRDALLGRTVSDWDVATDALPDKVQQLFRRTIPTGIQHGTVTAIVSKTPIEVTTFRGEGAYSDARRPDSVTFGVSLDEDLARRDFVINAMAYDPHRNELVDPFGGQQDLKARRLRAVGDPAARFGEDGLRVLRAVRFAAQLDFTIEGATERAIPGALDALSKVSRERVRVELLKLLAAPAAVRGLEIADRTGILGLVLPERVVPITVVAALPPDSIVRLAGLVAGQPASTLAAMGKRLTLANHERDRVLNLLAALPVVDSAGPSDADARRFVSRVGKDALADIFALKCALGQPAADFAARCHAVVAAGDPLAIADLAVDGRTLMDALSLSPGPAVGTLLRALLELVFDDPQRNTRDQLIAAAQSLSAK